MKKHFSLFILLGFLFTIVVSSCSKKDERPPEPITFNVKSIYGTWVESTKEEEKDEEKEKDETVVKVLDTLVFTRANTFTSSNKKRCGNSVQLKGKFKFEKEVISGKEEDVLVIESSCNGLSKSVISYIRTIEDQKMILEQINPVCKKDCKKYYKKIYDL